MFLNSFRKLVSHVPTTPSHPAYTLTLYGFTNQQANEQYNLKLSLRRAQAVSQYLTQQGVSWM
ncbi:OmpA family protein [Bacillus sp. D-CC]